MASRAWDPANVYVYRVDSCSASAADTDGGEIGGEEDGEEDGEVDGQEDGASSGLDCIDPMDPYLTPYVEEIKQESRRDVEPVPVEPRTGAIRDAPLTALTTIDPSFGVLAAPSIDARETLLNELTKLLADAKDARTPASHHHARTRLTSLAPTGLDYLADHRATGEALEDPSLVDLRRRLEFWGSVNLNAARGGTSATHGATTAGVSSGSAMPLSAVPLA